MTERLQDTDSDLQQLIRKNFLQLIGSLILLGAGAALGVYLYHDQIQQFAQLVFDTIGLGGLVAIIFISDCVVSPFPPDTVLLLISQSTWHQHWLWLIPVIGVVSSFAGMLGYFLGRYFGKTTWGRTFFERFRESNAHLIYRFGGWAVALGALTPLPFSITCWSSGILKVPFSLVWKLTLLRVPRYVIYYVVIAFAPSLLNF
ncbi:MAG: VTT domain-containing protein [Polyangiaceae bacterium]|nr:VTT domain-containing protein [Polyangiaceae bacterium]